MTKAGQFSDFPLRFVTALGIFAVLIFAILLGEISIVVLLLLAACLLGFETYRMAGMDALTATLFGCIQAFLLAGVLLGSPLTIMIGCIGTVILSFRTQRQRWGGCIILSAYALAGLSAVNFLGIQFGGEVLLAMLIVTAATDTGAYLAGRIFAGSKLWPKVSPNKTWAGLAGGLFFGGLASYLFLTAPGLESIISLFQWDNGPFFQGFPMWCAGLFVILVVLGDLAISVHKRRCEIKDSGRIFPGHGGIWDRFDGFGLATSGAWLFSNMGLNAV